MVGVVRTTIDLSEAEPALARLSNPDLDDLAFEAGQLIEGQTTERIATGKTAPDGGPWPAWSADYAATRGAHHSLLVGEGDLRDSIANYTQGPEARVGTNLVYGAIQQFGGQDVGQSIPARPYLGLSDDDRAEVEQYILDRLEELTR